MSLLSNCARDPLEFARIACVASEFFSSALTSKPVTFSTVEHASSFEQSKSKLATNEANSNRGVENMLLWSPSSFESASFDYFNGSSAAAPVAAPEPAAFDDYYAPAAPAAPAEPAAPLAGLLASPGCPASAFGFCIIIPPGSTTDTDVFDVLPAGKEAVASEDSGAFGFGFFFGF